MENNRQAEELDLSPVELEMLQILLREWPLLGEWLLREFKIREKQAIESLIRDEDRDNYHRGYIMAYRDMRERMMSLREEILGSEDTDE